MKKRIAILFIVGCMCLSLILSSCDKKTPNTPVEATTDISIIDPPLYSYPPEIKRPYYFEDYSSLAAAFLPESNSAIQQEKSKFGDKNELFIDYLTETQNIMIPKWNGQDLSLWYASLDSNAQFNIYYFKHDRHGLPWIWYNCRYLKTAVDIRITNPMAVGVEGITEGMTASDVLKQISPSALDPHRYPGTESIYNQSIILKDATVSALVWKYVDSSRMEFVFCYKDTLVSVLFWDESLLTNDAFWKGFFLESVADGALS